MGRHGNWAAARVPVDPISPGRETFVVERIQRFIITLSGDPGARGTGGDLPFQSVSAADALPAHQPLRPAAKPGRTKTLATAAAGRDAFAGLGVGVMVLALAMAAGCGRGVSRRLAEYR